MRLKNGNDGTRRSNCRSELLYDFVERIGFDGHNNEIESLAQLSRQNNWRSHCEIATLSDYTQSVTSHLCGTLWPHHERNIAPSTQKASTKITD